MVRIMIVGGEGKKPAGKIDLAKIRNFPNGTAISLRDKKILILVVDSNKTTRRQIIDGLALSNRSFDKGNNTLQALGFSCRIMVATSAEEMAKIITEKRPALTIVNTASLGAAAGKTTEALAEERMLGGGVIFVGTSDQEAQFDAGLKCTDSGLKARDFLDVHSMSSRGINRTFLTVLAAWKERAETTVAFWDQTLENLGRLQRADGYTEEHSCRVAGYLVLLAMEMGYTSKRIIDAITVGGIAHDTGKLSPDIFPAVVADQRLTDREFALIKRHSADGLGLIKHWAAKFDREIFEIVSSIVGMHHEAFDGSGYPHKLAGEAIPIWARMAVVADAFDAMTTRRINVGASRNRPLTAEEATAELLRCSGRASDGKVGRLQFDPKIVDAFLRVLKRGIEITGEEHTNNITTLSMGEPLPRAVASA